MAQAGELPRVAFLFTTRGPMPLEPMWRVALAEAAKEQLPVPSQAELAAVLQEGKAAEVEERVAAAGGYTASNLTDEAECISVQQIKVQ